MVLGLSLIGLAMLAMVISAQSKLDQRTLAQSTYCADMGCLYGCTDTASGGVCNTEPTAVVPTTYYCSKGMSDDCVYGCIPDASGGYCTASING